MTGLKSLNQLQNFSAQSANQQFKEATRSASFNMSYGVQETRLLASRLDPFRHKRHPGGGLTSSYTASDLAALQRLISKGLVVMENGRPELSEEGRLVRQLMILSGHIVVEEPKSPVESPDILDIMKHAVDWYRQGNSALRGARIQRVDGERQLIIETKASYIEQRDRSSIDQPTVEWVVRPEQVTKVG